MKKNSRKQTETHLTKTLANALFLLRRTIKKLKFKVNAAGRVRVLQSGNC